MEEWSGLSSFQHHHTTWIFIFWILGKERTAQKAMNTWLVERFANDLPIMCHHFHLYLLELLLRPFEIHCFFLQFTQCHGYFTEVSLDCEIVELNLILQLNQLFSYMQNLVNWEVILLKDIDDFPSLFLHFAGGWWSPWLYKVTNRTAGAGSVWRKSDWYIASWQGRAQPGQNWGGKITSNIQNYPKSMDLPLWP